jgi:GT2 family glycosyltransferase
LITLSVIIPSYHRPENLRRCLEGLAGGARLPEETLVVLHEADGESQETLAQLPEWAARLNLRTVLVTQAGQIPQMNAGLAQARCEVVCFTDDDCVPRPEWLARLAQPYGDPEVGGVGGRDVVHNLEGVNNAPGKLVGRITRYGRIIGNHHLVFPPGNREVEHLKGANMSFRRALTPPLDLRMVLGPGTGSMNDTDLSLSVRRSGCRLIYDPEAAVDHYPAPRHGITHRDLANPEQVFLDSHNWAYLNYKHFSWPHRLLFLGYALALGSGNRLGLVKFLLAVVRRPRGAVRQYQAACRGLRAGLRDSREARRSPAGGGQPGGGDS